VFARNLFVAMSLKRSWTQLTTQPMSPPRSQKRLKVKAQSKPRPRTGPGVKISRGVVGSNLTFLPKKRKYTFNYSDAISVSALAVGTMQGHAFNGNGLYDPDDTATGHQPRGFDQIKTLYRTYKVIASTIRVRFVGTATGAGVFCGLLADPSSDSNPTTSTIYDAMEVYKNNGILTNTDGSRGIVELRDRRTTVSMQYNKDSDSSEALMSANPANTWLWRILVWNAHPTAAFTGVVFVDLVYEAEFSEPVEPASS